MLFEVCLKITDFVPVQNKYNFSWNWSAVNSEPHGE